MSAILDAALAYAARGLRVFPVHSIRGGACTCGKASCSSPGKHPPLPEWDVRATTEADQLRAWWRTWPWANVAVAAGVDSGVLVVDIDGEEGALNINTWQALYGALPPTPTVLTARGQHLYFRHPGEQCPIRNSVKRAAEGIDVRTDGGYVVAAPSSHASGTPYAWAEGLSPADLPYADMPDWLIKRLATKPKAEVREPAQSHEGHTRYGQRALDEECMDLQRTPEGQRNQKLNAVAFRVGQLVAAGHLGESAATSDLRRSARACGLEESEIKATIASGLAAGQAKPNPSDPRPEQYAPRAAERGDQPPAGEAERAQEAPQQQPKGAAPRTLTAHETAKSALDQATDPKRARMPRTGLPCLDDALGGLAAGTMFTIGGRTGAGKSSLLLTMAIHQSRLQGHRVGIVSCEDPEYVWGLRLIASLQNVNPKRFFKYPPDDRDVGLAAMAVEEARGLGIHFAFELGRPIDFISKAVTRLVKDDGCGIIMVDYLQAISAKGEKRYEARTDAAQELKGNCHRLGVPLLLASQLKRAEGDAFKEPTNNDLKDSGDIENMSEAIILLWPLSDQQNAPVAGKVTKGKMSDEKPRFGVERNPESGSVCGLGVEPKLQTERKRGAAMPERYYDGSYDE